MPIPSFENCYWVEPGRFLAGEYPGHWDDLQAQARLAALLDAGVRAFVDLTTEADGLRPYAPLLGQLPQSAHLFPNLPLEAGLQDARLLEARLPAGYQRFPIRDVSVPHSPAFTTGILDAIDAHLAAGRLVYVHCWGGVGRTGVIVGCWLARHLGNGAAALARLRELWQACPKALHRVSPETREQVQYIVEWQG